MTTLSFPRRGSAALHDHPWLSGDQRLLPEADLAPPRDGARRGLLALRRGRERVPRRVWRRLRRERGTRRRRDRRRDGGTGATARLRERNGILARRGRGAVRRVGGARAGRSGPRLPALERVGRGRSRAQAGAPVLARVRQTAQAQDHRALPGLPWKYVARALRIGARALSNALSRLARGCRAHPRTVCVSLRMRWCAAVLPRV